MVQIMPHHLELPDEVQTEIIVKLPVKSLLRFKSVRKYWRDLIESPEFARRQLDYSNSSRCSGEKIFFQIIDRVHPNPEWDIRCYSAGTSLSFKYLTTFPRSSQGYGFKVCSSDGLLLVHQELEPFEKMWLWNPSINKIREIIHPAPSPETFISALGFGYDSNTQDYKIVILDRKNYSYEALIYTVKKSSWRTIQGFPDSYNYIIKCNQTPVFFRGYVHFVALHRREGRPCWRNDYGILRINLAGERFVDEILSVPVSKSKIIFGCGFKIIEGRLSLQFQTFNLEGNNHETRRVEVWTMMEYGNSDSWTQTSSSVAYSLYQPIPEVPVAVMQNGDLLVHDLENNDLFLHDKRRDLKRKVKMPEITNSGAVPHFHTIHSYSESLVTP